MNISIAQIDCEVGETRINHNTIIENIQETAEDGSDLIVLPEMADTGYEMKAIQDCAERWEETYQPDKTFVRELRRQAIIHKIAIICGLAERDGDNIYNSVVAIDKEGHILGKYRKAHLFSLAGEDKVLTAGNEFVVVPIEDANIGLMICYDMRFPEMSRKLVDMGADILVIVSAFPFPRLRHWEALTVSRAIENQVYVVAANRIGTDKDLTFCGSSCIIDPDGVRLVMASEGMRALVTVNIDLEYVNKSRSRMDILSDRRQDLY